MKRRLGFAVAIASLGALGATACASIFGFEELVATPVDAATPDTGVAADAGIDAPVPPECLRLGTPDPPAASTESDGGTYVIAASSFDLGLKTDGGGAPTPVGLNLDLRCTNAPSEGSCTINNSPSDFDDYTKDKPNGVDNAGFALLSILASRYDELSPEKVNARLRAGDFGLVARVERYNGTPNDPDVRVTVQPALGVNPQPRTTRPKFDGTDEWVTDARFYSIPDADYPNHVSTRAYVSGGKLVAKFAQLQVAVSMPDAAGRPLDILLDDSWVLGDVRLVAGELYLENGVLAGRWLTKNLFRSVGELKVDFGLGSGPQIVCQTPTIFDAAFRPPVCNARDLVGGNQPELPCNSISAGFGFTAVPAKATTFTNNPVVVPLPAFVCPENDCK